MSLADIGPDCGMIEGLPSTALAFILGGFKKLFALKYPPFKLFKNLLMPVTEIFTFVVQLNIALVVAIIAVVFTEWKLNLMNVFVSMLVRNVIIILSNYN